MLKAFGFAQGERVQHDTKKAMKLGFIGLGKMGSRMVLKLIFGGHDLVVWNRTREKGEELKMNYESRIKNQGNGKRNHNSEFMIHDSITENLQITKDIQELVHKLPQPRVI